MSEFNDECTPRETYAEMERRHKAEIRKLEGEVRALLKTAKKGNKAQIEAQTIQMQYDLKAKHQQEEDDMDASGGKLRECSFKHHVPVPTMKAYMNILFL